MFYISLSLLFLLLQTFLIVTTNFNLWPEMYFLPWLVHKGLLPYRDFFDHHGFLLYYLLAPFTIDRTFFLLKLFYFAVMSINLLVGLLVLRKITTRSGFIAGGLLFVLLGYFVGENNLWYETVITTLYLLLYLLLLTREFSYKSYIVGILIASVSFIKPTAGIIIIPLFLLKKDFRIVVAFLFTWMVVIFCSLFNNSLGQLIDGTLLFNSFLAKNYRQPSFSDAKFLLSSFFLVCFSISLAWGNRRLKDIILPLSFLICSLSFLFTGYGRTHLLPIFTFFIILVILPFKYRQSWYKTMFVVLLLGYIALLARKVVYHHDYLNSQRVPWQEDRRSIDIVKALQDINIKNEKIYLFSNHPEIYQALDQLPPTYFALKFPLTEKYFPDYEKHVISDMRKNNVVYVIIPKLPEEGFSKLVLLKNFIEENYVLIKDTEQYQIYKYG